MDCDFFSKTSFTILLLVSILRVRTSFRQTNFLKKTEVILATAQITKSRQGTFVGQCTPS